MLHEGDFVLLVRLFFAALLLGGCTQDFGVFEGDAALSTDAATDASSSDGALDAHPMDASPGSDASDAAPPSDGGLFQCGATTVADCSSCTGMPEPCVYCSTTSSTTLAGVCRGMMTSCAMGAPSGFQLCTCSGSPSGCPESYQVCRMGSCRTCEESFMNNNLACQGGGMCHAFSGMCQ